MRLIRARTAALGEGVVRRMQRRIEEERFLERYDRRRVN